MISTRFLCNFLKSPSDFECDEEGFVCEHCERLVRPACAGLVSGLEFLADTDVAQKGGKDSDSHLVAKPPIAAASHGRPSVERVAQDLLMVKDFSYPGLLSLANDFPTKVRIDNN